MTDQERIKNLEEENHALRETAREWKNACEFLLSERIKKRNQATEPKPNKPHKEMGVNDTTRSI